MASATEIFRVVGKVVLEGQDIVEKSIDALSKKAGGLDTSFKSGLGNLGKNVPKNVTKPIDDSIDTTANRMKRFESQDAKSFTDVIKSGFGIGLGMKAFDAATGIFEKFGGAVKNSIFGMNSTLQTSELQFTTLMGNADDAKKQVAFLFDFAKKTPFETEPIINASKLLQTFGGNALNTEKNITLIGDAAAATNAPIDELGMWTGRLYASLQAGKPFGDAASRLGELAVLTPQARLEMEKMQAEGKSADEIFTYFQGTLGRFSGAMDKQAGTWQGLTSTFTDTINIVSAKAMKPFFDLASKGLGQLNTLLGSDAFSKGAENIANSISNILSGAISALTDAVTTIGPKVVSAFKIGRDAVTTFSQALSGNWTNAPGILGIHQIFGNIGLVIKNNVLPLFSQVQDFLTNAFTQAVPIAKRALAGLGDLLGPVVAQMQQSFSRILPNLQSIGQQIGTMFTGTILPALQSFAAAAGPIIQQVGNYLTGTILPAYNNFRETVVQTFTQTIVPAITNFVATVLPPLTQFAEWFAGQVVQRIIQFNTDIVGIFTGQLMPAIVGFVQTVMPMLQSFGEWFVSTALPQIQTFAAAVLQAWDEIEPKLIAAITNILTIVTQILGVILTFVQAHGDQIQAYLTLAWNQISGTIGGVLEIIKNTIKLVLDIISGNWQGAWDDVQGIFKGAWDTIIGILSPAITILQVAISAFTTFVGNIFSALGTTTNTIWTAISNAIQTAMTAVQNFLTPILSAIQTIWNTTWTAIQVIADTVWRAIETIVRVEMALVQTIMEPILTAIQNVWTTVWNAIQNVAQTVWDFINQNIITPIFNTISTFINTSLNTIQTVWNTIWNAVQTTANTVWNTIQSTITTIWNTISNAATTTWNAIQTAIETPINAAKATLETIWTTIHDTADRVWTSVKKIFTDAQQDIKNALFWPFEQLRDGVEGVMKAAGNKLLSPLQGAINGFGDFVGGVRDAINSISNKLGLGDIIRDTWSGAKIRQLRLGTEYWRGGNAIVGEHGVEAVQYPDGTVRMFRAAQLVNIPAGAKIFNAYETRSMVKDNPNINVHDGMSDALTYGGAVFERYGKGGAWGAVTGVVDKVKGLAGSALDYARSIAAKGAEKVVGELIDHLPLPSFPGDMASIPAKAASAIKDKVIESVKELVKLVKDNAPADASDPSTWGAPGTINGVSGDTIMRIAQQTGGGVLGFCERWVGDVMARAGVKYARAIDAFAHSQMQPTTPGTGPLGAPMFTGFDHPGDVAISMGNGMAFGTEGGRGTAIGAGPFKPYAGARFTLNPAANGMVIDRPTAILAGESIRSQKEIVTPENLMSSIVQRELARAGYGGGINVTIQVTANDAQSGYAAGKAAGNGFRDVMQQNGYNR
jgi:phage-related protein